MRKEKDSAFIGMFDHRWFINMARLAMLVTSLIGLPVAGYFMNRVIAKADAIVETVDKTAYELKLLDQSVRFSTSQQEKEGTRTLEVLRDHEGRIRTLEASRPAVARPDLR